MESIKAQLTAAGLRLTKPRLAVFAALDHKPQSVVEISHKLARKKLQINKVTVYRTLTSFVKLGLVEQTQFKDQVAVFELADHRHHHHVLCEGCGKIEDISLDEELLVKAAKKKSSFEIKSHHLEFFGLCRKCA